MVVFSLAMTMVFQVFLLVLRAHSFCSVFFGLGLEPAGREYRNQVELTFCSVACTVTIGGANSFSLTRLPYPAPSSVSNQRPLPSTESAQLLCAQRAYQNTQALQAGRSQECQKGLRHPAQGNPQLTHPTSLSFSVRRTS